MGIFEASFELFTTFLGLDLLSITPVLRVFCTFSPKFDYFGENVQKTRSTGVIGNKSSPK